MEHWWNDADRGKPKHPQRTLTRCDVFNTNLNGPTWNLTCVQCVNGNNNYKFILYFTENTARLYQLAFSNNRSLFLASYEIPKCTLRATSGVLFKNNPRVLQGERLMKQDTRSISKHMCIPLLVNGTG